MPCLSLPIDDRLPEIREALVTSGACVIVAPPGSGKTTRVAPFLVEDGPVILLQPRRVAARTLARRIAQENAWTIGDEIGWQVRFENRTGPRTRLVVATEGILTARMMRDPFLEAFKTVILDEFHERSLHTDLALAMVRQAREVRADLRIVVMSATLDPGPVSAFLGGAPVLNVPGRVHPITIEHRDEESLPSLVDEILGSSTGHLLIFLPGAREIQDTQAILLPRVGTRAQVFPLHGALSLSDQDRVLAVDERRKIILATNIAETSLTIDGVTDVIDTGTHKVARYDDTRGLDRLELERISMDCADQRAGRAGRTSPGRAFRLWDHRLDLAQTRTAEIDRVDLIGSFLSILAWGESPEDFHWFQHPQADRIERGLQLLEDLGAYSNGKITTRGLRFARLPVHPRFAAVIEAASDRKTAATACALLSERDFYRGPVLATTCDLWTRIEALHAAPPGIRATVASLIRSSKRLLEPDRDEGVGSIAIPLERALLAGFPDRLGRRRQENSDRVLLASGHGARIDRSSGVVNGELVLALDVSGGVNRGVTEATIRLAAQIERDWIVPDRNEIVHFFDEEARRVRAVRRVSYRRLTLSESTASVDPEQAAPLLIEAFRRLGPGPIARIAFNRMRVAGLAVDPDEIYERACCGRTQLPDLDPLDWVPPHERARLDTLAPAKLELPSGRFVPLTYEDDGTVVLEAKLQELFGLAETPRVGSNRRPLRIHLLAPNRRPVQVTQDLVSFWNRTYPEIRKELRGRYPKHPWPEDPWTVPATHRTKRGQGRRMP